MANLEQDARDGVVIEHHDDDALRLEATEQRAAVERLGPARIWLEEDVTLGKGSEIEIDAGLAADVGQAACQIGSALDRQARNSAPQPRRTRSAACPSAH
jgi:hypothetical protein